MTSNNNAPVYEQLATELTELEKEEKALTRAITKLYLLAHKRPTITEEDVALLREAKRDAGRARQIAEGIARKWGGP